MSEIRIADLFAGIGGIRMGMVQALGDAAHVVYSSEWNKYSVQTYEANWHDENPVAGDITKVDEHDVPDIDLLLAGFPCQPFSIAGVSKKQSMGRPTGFEDKTQGTLFFDVARIVKESYDDLIQGETMTFSRFIEEIQGLQADRPQSLTLL